MKRRFIVALFVLLLAFALVFTGCAKKEEAKPAEEKKDQPKS